MASDKRFDSKQLTKPQSIFRQIWRKAYKEGGVTLTFDRISDAHRFRMGMYGERKKANSAEIDEELGQAMLNCEITAPKELQVIVRLREEGTMMHAALRGLDLGVEEAVAAEEGLRVVPGQAAISASMAKMLSLLSVEEEEEAEVEEAKPPVRAPNPYYTRED